MNALVSPPLAGGLQVGAIKKEAWLRPIGAAHGVAVLGVRGHERMLTTSQKITVGEMR